MIYLNNNDINLCTNARGHHVVVVDYLTGETTHKSFDTYRYRSKVSRKVIVVFNTNCVENKLQK